MSGRGYLVVLGSVAWLVGLFATNATAEDWPRWRGPHANGSVREASGWRGDRWAVEKKAAWTARVGEGGSAPVVAGGRLFTLGWVEDEAGDGSQGRDRVRGYDAASGRLLWSQSYSCPRYGRRSEGDKGLYSGPSASPAFDAATGFLFTLSCDGDFQCWDTARGGRRVWAINFYSRYNVAQRPKVGRRRLRDYGYTSAPMVHGDWVLAEVGDDMGSVMAFDKRTGKRVWSSQAKDPAGHTGGMTPITVDGIPCVVVLTIRNLLVIRLDSGHAGKTLAKYPWVTDFANSIATPAVHGQSIVITSEYNQYAICRLDVTRSGIKQVWKQPFASGVCSPVIHKGHVYWCWRGVYCLDFARGTPIWRGGIFGDTASLIATSDDRLVLWAGRGELVLAETASRSPKKFTELARKRRVFSRDVWPHLVLAGGRYYCRDRDGNLKCFRVTGSSDKLSPNP